MAKAKKVVSAEEAALLAQWAAEDAAFAARSAARAKYTEMYAKCHAAQAAHPDLYLFDECISRENASEGLASNEGHKLPGHECDWAVVDFEYMTRNLEADTGYRLAEAGLDPSKYGIRF
jgi:hypothetical protein